MAIKLKKSHSIRSEGIYSLYDHMVMVGFINEKAAEDFSCKKLDKYYIIGKDVLYDEDTSTMIMNLPNAPKGIKNRIKCTIPKFQLYLV
jgi:hypothetical protein